jgi:hypothetical protein
MTSGESVHGRPTAAELVTAVAKFLETQVHTDERNAQDEVSAAAYAVRIVERELLDTSIDADTRQALAGLGFSDEAQLARRFATANSTTAPTTSRHACVLWSTTGWRSPTPDIKTNR